MAQGDPFKPYVNTINENDPIMKRVPRNDMDIAANAASMPKGTQSNDAAIQHVSNQNSK
jgi:hypothetical protein